MSLAESASISFSVPEAAALPAASSSSSSSASSAAAAADISYSRKSAISESLRLVPLKKLGVPCTHMVGGVVYYEVEAFNRKFRWNVFRRFEQFSQLYADLEALAAPLAAGFVMPPFPSRMPKLLVDHANADFIEQRRVLLDNFLAKLVPFADLCESSSFFAFVVPEDDDPFVPPSSAPRAPPEPELEHEVIDEQVFSLDGRRKADEEYTEITSVAVPCAQVLKSEHVVYQVSVTNEKRRKSFQRWTVLKRFSDVCAFDAALRTALAAQPSALQLLPALPPKYSKFVFNHLDEQFIEHRRILLEAYLQKLVACTATQPALKKLASAKSWHEFFGV